MHSDRSPDRHPLRGIAPHRIAGTCVECLVEGVEVQQRREAAQRAKEKNLPTMAVDSRLTLLTKSNSGSDVAIAAKVEFLIRKIPEQSLKATVKGDAKALAKVKTAWPRVGSVEARVGWAVGPAVGVATVSPPVELHAARMISMQARMTR